MSAVIDFAQDLWMSVLTPGTTPALITATHASFASLLVILLFLLYATRNIHFVFLTIIASGLWAAITWFIYEIEQDKIKQQLLKQEQPENEATKNVTASSTAVIGDSTSKSSVSATTKSKSRKI